jgi:hypothetical protein
MEHNYKTDAPDDECLSEWVKLNENIYFKQNMAFFYTDLNIIRLYLERRKSSVRFLSIKLNVEFKLKNKKIFNQSLLLKKNEIISQVFDFSFESIESELNLNDENIQKEDIESGKVRVILGENTVSLPIQLNIKLYRAKDQDKKHTFVCSDFKRGYKSKDVNSFRWHIEMHKLNGYDKLIIYTNKMENIEEFNRLFREYIGFVEIIQYKCMPNFKDKTTLFLREDFYELNYRLADHFEHLIYLECYLHNMDKYKYITVTDLDEIIIPRYFKQNTNIQDISENKCNYLNQDNSNKSKTDLEIYLNSLKKILEKNEDVSFHFKNGLYMNMRMIDNLFKQLELLINSSTKSFPRSFRVVDRLEDFINFECKIRNKKEYNYSLYLLNIYKTLIQPLKSKYDSISDLISEPFNRYFYLKGKKTVGLWGKTIHNTLLTETLNHHMPVKVTKDSIITIPHEYGHVSHFRGKNYLDLRDEISITELHFDLDYFFCFYKPILKKFITRINLI